LPSSLRDPLARLTLKATRPYISNPVLSKMSSHSMIISLASVCFVSSLGLTAPMDAMICNHWDQQYDLSYFIFTLIYCVMHVCALVLDANGSCEIVNTKCVCWNMATRHVSLRHISHYLRYYTTVVFALTTVYCLNISIVLYIQLATLA
jgi:hypothetical protein